MGRNDKMIARVQRVRELENTLIARDVLLRELEDFNENARNHIETIEEELTQSKARIRELEDIPRDLRNKELIKEFCKLDGAMEVHRAWRDKMLEQDRDVRQSQMVFDLLKSDDKELDAYIAYETIMNFCDYILTHPHERINALSEKPDTEDAE